MTKELKKKVRQAIRLLRSAEKAAKAHGEPVEIAYSGGKDSEVILELAKVAKINFVAIYKNTTIDPPGTLKHVLEKGAQVITPKMSFLEIVAKVNIPTRRARTCCSILKEYKVLNVVAMGVRRAESTKRARNYQEPTECRWAGRGKKPLKKTPRNEHNWVQAYYPILYWSNDDVASFIKSRGLQCHPIYYDEDGVFHPERRLGCMGCPLRWDKGFNDFLERPAFLRQYIKAMQAFWDTHPNARIHDKFEDVYELFFHNVFCERYEEFVKKKEIICKTGHHSLYAYMREIKGLQF